MIELMRLQSLEYFRLYICRTIYSINNHLSQMLGIGHGLDQSGPKEIVYVKCICSEISTVTQPRSPATLGIA